MTTRTTSSQGSHGSLTSRAQDTRSASQSSSRDDQSSHGKQGFASMPKEKVQEIAREGGKHSHDNDPDRNRK